MGIYDNWTYTDLHQLNLDWVLAKVKEAIQKANTLEIDFAALKEYVDNFLINLDIDEAVKNELQQMYDDGTLADIIGQVLDDIQNQVNKLEQKNDYFNISPAQDIIYDTASNKTMQGAFIDNNNLLYMYTVASNSSSTGSFLVFNALTHEYVSEISDVELYHGNGMCYKGGKVYSADFYDSSGNYSTGISVYDLVNFTTEHHSELSATGFNRAFGVTNYDANHILVAMSKYSDRLVKNIAFVKVDIYTWQYEIMNISSFHNLPLNSTGSLLCDIHKIDNSVYLLTTFPNTLIEFKIDDNESLSVNATYNIPNYDRLGLPFGELEGLTAFPSNYFGTKTMLFTGSINPNYVDSDTGRTFSAYLFNIAYNIPDFMTTNHVEVQDGQGRDIYVSNQPGTTLLEYGSDTLPFRTLQRAIDNYNRDTRSTINEIKLLDAGTYNLGSQYNKKIRINNNGNIVTLRMGNTYQGCNIDIYDDNPYATTNITIDFVSPVSGYGSNFFNTDLCITGATITTSSNAITNYVMRCRRSNIKMSYTSMAISKNMTGIIAADFGCILFLELMTMDITGTLTYAFNINRQSILLGNSTTASQTINRGTGSIIFSGAGTYRPA